MFAKLNIALQFSKWEKIIPIFLVLIICAAFVPHAKKTHKRSIQTIVIDAGHGGHDPGCHNGDVKEKDVTLAIALAVGKKIEQTYPDVKIIYTRSTDRFVELWERADIANKSNADLFISIHCNSHKNKAISGTETFAMGLNKANENLDVAKRENNVVLLESDYQEMYDGFDPNSPESHIYFSLYQNAYMDQSIRLAAKVESEISKGSSRESRGVKQAGFVVLWKTKMPSILIETGFLSNQKDCKYLKSKDGVDEIAASINKAVQDYRGTVEGTYSTKNN